MKKASSIYPKTSSVWEGLPQSSSFAPRDEVLLNCFENRVYMSPIEIPRMRIPVFISAPSPDNLSPAQDESMAIIRGLVSRYKLEWRALGRSDYPNDLPLKEVLRMVKHCSGGIILGFEQFRASAGEFKPGSPKAKTATAPVSFPTPWNQLEAGILFSAGLPIIIFRETGIIGGVFDVGTSEVFIHQMPSAATSPESLDDLDSIFQNWVARVRTRYYAE